MQIATPRPQIRTPQALAQVAAPVAHIAQSKARAPSTHNVKNAPTLTKGEMSRAPVVGDVTREGATSAEPGASAAPAAPVAAQVASNPPRHIGGYMPLGAEQPEPVLDPTVRNALGALQVHVTLLVTVDDSGHMKDVVFQPPLDAATEARIRAMLANASWDPATCGAGVPCEAVAKITL